MVRESKALNQQAAQLVEHLPCVRQTTLVHSLEAQTCPDVAAAAEEEEWFALTLERASNSIALARAAVEETLEPVLSSLRLQVGRRRCCPCPVLVRRRLTESMVADREEHCETTGPASEGDLKMLPASVARACATESAVGSLRWTCSVAADASDLEWSLAGSKTGEVPRSPPCHPRAWTCSTPPR